MMNKFYPKTKSLFGILCLQIGLVNFASAQVTGEEPKDSVKQINEVVITGVTNPKKVLSSSISISTLKPEQIESASPRTTSEIFKQISGIRSESSGGDGNTNISVRGVPIATGGSKYLLIQEDGLPVLQFGDISFATQDQFVRADANISRIEAVKGGSASILASNSPAGIINFISKDGTREGGSVATSFGVDYKNFRTDIEYGTKIAEGLYMHVGGFYRQGVGPRNIGYTGNDGGQFKGNITKRFDKGYVKFYVKVLRDHTAAYMPMPISVSGTNASPKWSSLSGFDASFGGLQSPFLTTLTSLNTANQPEIVDVRQGMTSNVNSVGSEFKINLGKNWFATGKSRYSTINGRFASPFPATVGSSASIANGLVGAGNTYSLAYTDGSAFNKGVAGNDMLMIMHLFNTKLNSFNNVTNDYSVSKNFNRVKLNAGVYQATQQLSMSWLWNSYLMDVSSNGTNHPQLVNLTSMDSSNVSTALTENGLLAYGVPAWGNCCQRDYNVNYSILAPYANVDVDVTDNMTFSGGVRYDIGSANGTYSGTTVAPNVDVNNDGAISAVETNVATINNNQPNKVNYKWDYLSYSAGLNYMINSSSAIFGRYSKGGRAGADRVLFSNFVDSTGNLKSKNNVVDFSSQAELGYKIRKQNLTVSTTAFFAQTDEKNFEATKQRYLNRTYQAYGVELEARYESKGFNVYGGFTFTKAVIAKDAIDTSVVGNTPRRQAALIYSVTPSYNFNDKVVLGVSVIGTTKSFAQDNNQLIMPGYAYFNPFITYTPNKNFSISLQSNNVLSAIGITESEEGSITPEVQNVLSCLLYTSPSPRDLSTSRMPSSA